MNEKELTGYHMLIAEDNPHNFYYINQVAIKNGIQVYHASNGAEAVKMCREIPELDIIFMDAMMPEMDGFEATREIKTFRPDIPIIMLTAFFNQESVRKAVAAGCNDYLSKPIGKLELLAAFQKWLILNEDG